MLSEIEVPSIDHIREHPGETHATMWRFQMELQLLKENLEEINKTLDEVIATQIDYLDPDK